MLSDADRRKAAELLLTADKEHKPIELPSRLWPEITIDDAYAIQSQMARQRVAAGAKVVGHKIGLTSKAMPDTGITLSSSMQHRMARYAPFAASACDAEIPVAVVRAFEGACPADL